MHIKLILEYDGTGLCGWQRQDNGPSVQGHLEAALAALLQQPVPVVGASRTDAGVHALGQVASFSAECRIPLHGIRRGLNSLLPDSIAVVAAEEVPDDFHPRFSACGKEYRYTLLNRPERSPLWRRRTWHRARPLDLAAMQAAAAALLGEHDFSAFRAAGCTARHARRCITAVEVTAEPPLCHVTVRGNAFLRNMVRIIAGTLVEVGEGRRPRESVAAALRSGRREDAGQTAPPHGLALVRVDYPPVPSSAVTARTGGGAGAHRRGPANPGA
jgi:tRNA pseudouridine38-40 synthase